MLASPTLLRLVLLFAGLATFFLEPLGKPGTLSDLDNEGFCGMMTCEAPPWPRMAPALHSGVLVAASSRTATPDGQEGQGWPGGPP